MNRFFSKLDLRDIKIDPRHTSFPPDADETEEEPAIAADAATAAAEPHIAEPDAGPNHAREPDAPSWNDPIPDVSSPTASDDVPFAHQPSVTAWAASTSAAVDRVAAPAPAAPASAIYGAAEAALPDEAPPSIVEGVGEPDLAAPVHQNGALLGSDGVTEVLKVSARSRPSAVAGAIAGVVREAGRAEVQAIGAGATNQAVKAVAIARDYLRETGIEAVCLPAFIDVTIENEDRTAIRLVVEPR